MISKVTVASRFPLRMPSPETAASRMEAGSRALSWLKKNGRSSVVTERSRWRRADKAASASGVRASMIWARADDGSSRSGLSITLNWRPATRARSRATSSAVKGDFATINVARPGRSDLARNRWSCGRSIPSSRSAAAAKLIRRPVSVMSFGLNQRDTVRMPLGVSAERKWRHPWVV